MAGARLRRTRRVPDEEPRPPPCVRAAAPRLRPRLRVRAHEPRRQDGQGRHVPDAEGGRPRVRRPREGAHGEEGRGRAGLRDRPFRRLADFPPRERRGRHRPGHHARDPGRRPRGEHLQAHRALQGARRAAADVRPSLDDRERPGQALLEARRRGVRGRVPRERLPPGGAVQLPAPPRVESRRRARGADARRDDRAVRHREGPRHGGEVRHQEAPVRRRRRTAPSC